MWDANEYGALDYLIGVLFFSLVVWVLIIPAGLQKKIIDMTIFWIVVGISFVIGEILFILKIRKERRWGIPSFGTFFLINFEIIATTPWVYCIGLLLYYLFDAIITYVIVHIVEVMNGIMWFMIIIFMLLVFYALKKELYEWVIQK